MKLFIDDREKERGERAFKYYTKQKIKTHIAELVIGDYLFTNDDIYCCFEYKTIEDYISSVNDKRVFNQAINQSRNFDYHFIIIVGDDKDYKKAVSKIGFHSKNYMSMEEWNGSIASLVNFSSVIQSKSEKWSFDLMLRIAEHCISYKPVVKRFPKTFGTPAYRLLVHNVNRVGDKKAEQICKQLNLVSVLDVFECTVDDFTKVKGIGVKTAKSIVNQLIGEYS